MATSDYWRTLGFEAGITAVQMQKPLQTTNVTPVLTASLDTSLYPRSRILLVINMSRAAQGVTFSVTESATSGGAYTAATTSGSLAKMTADGVEYISVQRNRAKGFLKVTATGDNAATDVTWTVTALFV